MKRENKSRSLGRISLAALAGCMAVALAGLSLAQADNNPLPHLVTKDGRHALMVEGKPFLVPWSPVAQFQCLAGHAAQGLARD